MSFKTRFDIFSQNFDYFFARKVGDLSQPQQEMIPKDIQFKLFRKGGIFNAQSSNKLSFLAKLFILIRCCRMKWVLIVEDQEEGLGPSDFFDLKSRFRKEKYTLTNAEVLEAGGFFCLGNKDLMDTFSNLNSLSTSPAYNYLCKVKNMPPNSVAQWKDEMSYIIRFLMNYESNKKKIVMQLGLTVAEIYTLFYLYDGDEKIASEVYKGPYRYAYNASRAQIQAGFVTLQSSGAIEKLGFKKGARLKITALGSSLVDDILTKYLINF